MRVGLMICFSHSGGTLLNRCLGCLPRVVVLSELNPLGGGSGGREKELRTVWDQARDWYGIELLQREYAAAVGELASICEANGLSLIVRDWSHINFVPHSANGGQPDNRLLNLEVLQHHLQVKAFGFVRDAIDVWLSAGCPEPSDFFPRYRRYAEQLVAGGVPIFRYEDFVGDPDAIMQEICAAIEIPFSQRFWDFQTFESVNGSVQGPTRGSRLAGIGQLPRRRLTNDMVRSLEASADMSEANRMLGYGTYYASRTVETFAEFALRRSVTYCVRMRDRVKLLKARLSSAPGKQGDSDG